MTSTLRALRSGLWCLLLLLALAALGTGCSGIQASKSISPLDFLLPGIGMTGTPDDSPVQQTSRTPS